MFSLFPIFSSRMGWSITSVLFLVLTAAVPSGSAFPPPAETPPAEPKAKIETAADFIDLAVTVVPQTVRRGQPFKVVIKGTPKPGYHTFPMIKQLADKQAFKSELSFATLPGLTPIGQVQESEPDLATTVSGRLYEHDRPFTWEQEVLVVADAKPGKTTLGLTVKLQACNASNCWPPQPVSLKAVVDVSAEEAVALTPELEKKLAAAANPPAAGDDAPGSSGLLAFLLTGVFWGLVSLITPCVFPMIPITVSFFLKQSEKEHHKPITMAAVYCATIVIVLTIAAVALLSFFRALSTNGPMNFVIGGLFIFFALSLFGMYEVELPSSLARFTSAREGQGGLLGTVFMALTFTIISFACVAPFLGGFGGTATDSNLTFTQRVLGGLAFAVTFASPFFILALFPALLKKLPKSGSWLNTIKVVMGFLELAAALKFLRAGELVSVSEPFLFTYDLVLGLYVALCLFCGLYLLGTYRLQHEPPRESLGVGRMLLSLSVLALALYLTPGLFKYGEKGKSQRPGGAIFAWLDSFILPDEDSGLPFIGQLAKGLDKAQEEHKLVFVDFTGVTCNNCRLNERNVFTQPEVEDLLKKYTRVALYTDKVPGRFYDEEVRGQVTLAQQQEDAEKNLQLQAEQFGTVQLPLYAVVEPLPDGKFKVLRTYKEGRINNPSAFIQFLSQPLAQRSTTQPVARAASVDVPGKDPKKLQSEKALPYVARLDEGLKVAPVQNKQVFVDFTGVKCVNCMINDKTVFTRPDVQSLLGRYALVSLYTDEVPAKFYSDPQSKDGVSEERRLRDAEANHKLERERFGHGMQPLYVILEPQADGGFQEVRRFGGRITDPAAFIQFLQGTPESSKPSQ